MNRRTLLSTVAVTFGSVLAGCSSSSSSDESSGSDPEEAQEHLDKAAAALDNAGEELDRQSEKFEGTEFQEGSVDLKTTSITGYLETASTELDLAEGSANEEQQETIEIVRGYISFLSKMVEFLDTFTDGYSEVYTGFTYFQSERYEDAVSQLETARSTLSETDDLLTVTRSRFDELNTNRLDSLEEVQIETAQSYLEDMDELLPAFLTMTNGLISVSKGMIDYTEGSTHLDNEQITEAEEAFRAAAEDFSAARSTFQEEEENAPTEVKSTFVELTCYSGALEDGSVHLANSMEAAQNQNRERAESEAQAAKEDLNRCDFSAS